MFLVDEASSRGDVLPTAHAHRAREVRPLSQGQLAAFAGGWIDMCTWFLHDDFLDDEVWMVETNNRAESICQTFSRRKLQVLIRAWPDPFRRINFR